MNPYQNRPDIFEIVVDRMALDIFDIRKTDYPWGLSEESYCYYDDVLIGLIACDASSSRGYYEGNGIVVSDRVVVSLIPTISTNQYLNIPNAPDFIKSISLLINISNSIDLICEADCGQSDVLCLERRSDDLVTALDELLIFLCGGEKGCPTFIVRKI